ncbi:MAG: hypothetical protein ACYCZV_17195 [Acidimicrobiales bacterium]
MPRVVEGPAVDPITLEAVDEIEVTTLVDNGFDGLLRLRGRRGLPLTVHPAVWTRRR